jgi:acetylornithine deacetylase
LYYNNFSKACQFKLLSQSQSYLLCQIKSMLRRFTLKILKNLNAQIEKIKPDLIDLLRNLIQVPSLPCTLEQNQCLDIIKDFLDIDSIKHDYWQPDWEKVEKIIAPSNGELLYTNNDAFKKVRDQISILVSTYGVGDKSIVLNGHVDVVSPEPLQDWTMDPFSGNIRDGRLYGRGAVDMKGGLVAHIGALKAIAKLELDLHGCVQLHAVPEEETGGNGTLACIARGYVGNGTIFAETTGEKILYHHTGIQDFHIHITGRPGFILWHTPGVDSIYAMGKIVVRLEQLQKERENEARHRMPDFLENDSPGFINIGKVMAGEWDATCPTYSDIQGLMALLPGETPQEAIQSIVQAVGQTLKDNEWFIENPPKVTYKSLGHLGGTLKSDHPLVAAFVQGAEQTGIKDYGPTRGGLMVCDAKITQGGGFSPSIVFGPSGWSAHAADEFVDIESVIQVAKTTAAGIINFLAPESMK